MRPYQETSTLTTANRTPTALFQNESGKRSAGLTCEIADGFW
jgi:hypothetical protein